MPKKPKEVKHKLGALAPSGEPALGMKFEDSRKKLLKYKSSRINPQLKESLIGQVEKHEGVEAGEDLRKEINYKYDEERKIKPIDFIHNPKGKLFSAGIDTEKERTYAWCDECNERCYIYSIIKGMNNMSLLRCSRCGTNCEELTKAELTLKEESNGRKNT